MVLNASSVGRLFKRDYADRALYYSITDTTYFQYDKDTNKVTYTLHTGENKVNIALSDITLAGVVPTNLSTFETQLALVFPKPAGTSGSSTAVSSDGTTIAGNGVEVSLRVITNSTQRFTTDTEKSTWNGKQAALGFTPVPNTRTVNGHVLNANVVVAPSDLAQDSTHRFATDLEKTSWNAKLATVSKDATLIGNGAGTPLGLLLDATHRLTTDAQQTSWSSKQAALGFTPEDISNKGVPNGYCPLDGNALPKVPSLYLPAYVDAIQNYADIDSLPATGSSNIIYITEDTNKQYRWTGSTYIEIAGSPGNTDAVPEGSVNKYFLDARALSAAPAETATTVGALINGATAKATPIDADQVGLMDSAAANIWKKLSWANIKATLKTYFDTIYQAALGFTAIPNTRTVNGHALSADVVISNTDIALDSTHRWATDAEKSTWNLKLTTVEHDSTISGSGTVADPLGAVALPSEVAATYAAIDASTVARFIYVDVDETQDGQHTMYFHNGVSLLYAFTFPF